MMFLLFPILAKNNFSPGQAVKYGLKFLIHGDFLTIYGKGFVAPRGRVLTNVRKNSDNIYRLEPSQKLKQYLRSSAALRSATTVLFRFNYGTHSLA